MSSIQMMVLATSIVSIVSSPITIQYLLVGGGGGGGFGGNGGGGGGGGILSGTFTNVNLSIPYPIEVGAGGAAVYGFNPASGSPSTAFVLTANGGGRGGNASEIPGGGASINAYGGPSNSQTNAGGNGYNYLSAPNATNGGSDGIKAGGGGGSGVTLSAGGNGGNGGIYSITGSSVTYAGGGGGNGTSNTLGGAGGGGAGSAQLAGTPGTNGLGGGGGAGRGLDSSSPGGIGGSGVIIIRYADSFPAATSTTGSPTITVAGGYRVYKWTTSGSITF